MKNNNLNVDKIFVTNNEEKTVNTKVEFGTNADLILTKHTPVNELNKGDDNNKQTNHPTRELKIKELMY